MRRGYTKRAYLDLVARIREEIPGVTFSSDFIVGFCGETEEEFQETLGLVEQVKYEMAFNFMYSLREKTKAHRTLVDDVPQGLKKERLRRLNEVYERGRLERLDAMVGNTEVVLIEKMNDKGQWMGRTDGNIRVTVEEISPKDETIAKGDFVSVKITGRARATPLSLTTI